MKRSTAYARALALGRKQTRRARRNPVPPSSAMKGRDSRVKQAARLYEDFTGEKAREIDLVGMPKFPDVGLVIGEITGIMYQTVRDGKLEDYIHEFKAAARPTFVVSHDGRQLLLLGGAYNFTARGIVDKR